MNIYICTCVCVVSSYWIDPFIILLGPSLSLVTVSALHLFWSPFSFLCVCVYCRFCYPEVYICDVKITQLCLTLQPHGLYSPWNSPGKNTVVGSCSLLQGIFETQDRTQVSHIAGGFFTS